MLYDCGVVSTLEPFQRLVNQGMILGAIEYTAYKNQKGEFVSSKEVNDAEEVLKRTGEKVFPVKVSCGRRNG